MFRGVKFWLAAMCLGFVLAFVATANTQAAVPNQQFRITTSPSTFSIKAKPGETVTRDIRVYNNEPNTEQLTMGIMKFGAEGEKGRPNLFERGPNDTYFDWITFSPRTFSAPNGQWVTIKVKITIPKTAGLGYYYAVTISRANNTEAKQGTSLLGRTAILILLDVDAMGRKPDLDIADFRSSKGFYQYLPASFSLRVHNDGNIHVAPVGNIFIKRGKEIIGTLDFNNAQGNVLPKSYRVFTADWKQGFPVYEDTLQDGNVVLNKKGEPERSLKWNLTQANQIRFGKYSAEANVVYNDGKSDVLKKVSINFWVIPWVFVAVMVAIVLVLGVGVWAMGRRVFRGAKKLRRKSKKSDA